MNWILIKQGMKALPVVLFVVLGFHYAYTLHKNDMLVRDNAVLSENLRQQQIVLDSIVVRAAEQERSISALKDELEAKQGKDITKVRKMLSKPVPSGCSDSLLYLKQEASSIVFE